MTELKPCPFCGAMPGLFYSQLSNESCAYVRCGSCRAHSGNYYGKNDRESGKKAARSWNDRVATLWEVDE